MRLDRDRPEILQPPENPQACCTQQTITVPPQVNAKTRQKHDYPSKAHRQSYARRTGAERGFATAKDPASNDISRGWCRLMGLTPLMLFTATLLIVRNQRILTAWNARQQDNAHRAAAACPRKPANAAGQPSPASQPRHHNSRHPRPQPPAPHRNPRHRRQHARSQRKPTRSPASRKNDRGNPANTMARPECQGKRENGPHGNVKTTGWS